MSRAILEVTAISSVDVTTNTNVVADAQIYVYETDGATRLQQSIYAAASGGSPLTQPLTANSLGMLVVYADRPQECIVRIGSETAATLKTAFRPSSEVVTLTTFDRFNVMAQPYNAVGDGITNDTAAILAAIADMGDRDELYFPPGRVFLIASALVFSGIDHIRISGGTGSRIKQSTALTNAITITDCQYVDIHGLALEGGNSAPIVDPGRAEHGIQIDENSSHPTIARCYFEKWGGQGIQSKADYTRVVDCELVGQNPTIFESQHSAILLYGNYSEASRNKCSLWSVGVHSSQASGLNAPQYQRITDNHLFSPTANGTSAENLNLPGGGNRAQIYAASGYYTYIGSNTIVAYQYGYGIKTGFGASGPVIEGNISTSTIDGTTKAGGGGGITVAYTQSAVVVGNTLDKSSLSVSYETVGVDPTGTVVIGNTIRNAPHLDATNGAIVYRGIHGIIAYNTIQDCYNHGIALTDLSAGMEMPYVQIFGNNIRQVGLKTHNTYSAICLGTTGGEKFTKLKIFNNQAFGTGANPQMKYFIDASGANDAGGSTIQEFGNTASGYATGYSVYHANVTLDPVSMESPLSVTRGIVGGSTLNITGAVTFQSTLTVAGLAPLAAKSTTTTALSGGSYTDVDSLSLGLGVGKWLVTACIDFIEVGAGDVGQTFDFILTRTGGTSSVLVDSSGTVQFGTAGERATISQQWVVVVTAATVTIKVRAEKAGGGGTSVTGSNSTLTAIPTWAA